MLTSIRQQRWELPEPRPSEVTRICHPTPASKVAARARREAAIYRAAARRLRDAGLAVGPADVAAEALAMHRSLENGFRLSPATLAELDFLLARPKFLT